MVSTIDNKLQKFGLEANNTSNNSHSVPTGEIWEGVINVSSVANERVHLDINGQTIIRAQGENVSYSAEVTLVEGDTISISNVNGNGGEAVFTGHEI